MALTGGCLAATLRALFLWAGVTAVLAGARAPIVLLRVSLLFIAGELILACLRMVKSIILLLWQLVLDRCRVRLFYGLLRGALRFLSRLEQLLLWFHYLFVGVIRLGFLVLLTGEGLGHLVGLHAAPIPFSHALFRVDCRRHDVASYFLFLNIIYY